MKMLSDYIEEEQTEAIDNAGAFFAFSKKQFDEQKEPDITYTSMGYGLICPKDKAEQLFEEISEIGKRGIEQDLTENGEEAIILRELANHEANVTHSIEDTVNALEGYDIPYEHIAKIYRTKFKKDTDAY